MRAGSRIAIVGAGVARLRRRDYLGDPSRPLAEAVRALVAERIGRSPDGPIRLLGNLRVLGHCDNPVAFYYCHGAHGRLDALVAEVTNTPWGERHAYVLPADGAPGVRRALAAKALHVSPFMRMDQLYAISATAPGRTLSVRIESSEAGVRVFDATLALRRRPLCRRTMAEVVARHAIPSLRTLALIYGHAVGLRVRGVPVHAHPS